MTMDHVGALLGFEDLNAVRAEHGLRPIGEADVWRVICHGCGIDLGDRRRLKDCRPECARCVVRRLDLVESSRKGTQITSTVESIPEAFRWAEVGDSLTDDRSQNGATNVLDGLVTSGQKMILLWGGAGTGKTTASCAVLRSRVTAGTFPWGRYVTAWELGRSDRDAKLGTVPLVRREASVAPLLVVDELGGEGLGADIVRDVLLDRANSGRATILCSWLDVAKVKATYGEGVGRRLVELGLGRGKVSS